MVANRAAFAFPRADLAIYSAKWWSYLVAAGRASVARRRGAADLDRGGRPRRACSSSRSASAGPSSRSGSSPSVRWLAARSAAASIARVPVLVVVAAAALLCSLSPERTIGGVTFAAALSRSSTPSRRCSASYARFGVVVQLMAALLAGIGLDCLRRAASRRAQIAGAAARGARPPPSTPSRRRRSGATCCRPRRTAGSTRQAGYVRALDCVPLTQESASVQWLTGQRTSAAGQHDQPTAPSRTCRRTPGGGRLHAPARAADSVGRRRLVRRAPAPDGFATPRTFGDGQVFAVTRTCRRSTRRR